MGNEILTQNQHILSACLFITLIIMGAICLLFWLISEYLTEKRKMLYQRLAIMDQSNRENELIRYMELAIKKCKNVKKTRKTITVNYEWITHEKSEDIFMLCPHVQLEFYDQ